MNKDELVIKLAEEFGISTIDIYQFVNDVFSRMQKAFEKGKRVNIPEFGKFTVITRKNEHGKPFKTLTFSPVRKFAEEVNFRFNNLSSIPVKTKEDESFIVNEELSEKIINYKIMSDKDNYDDNFIRDEFPEDSSMDAIEAFIKSKLDKASAGNPATANDESGEIKEFELPHNIIQLHNDITQDEPTKEELNISTDNNLQDNTESDLSKIIEERKKALEQTGGHEVPKDIEPIKEEKESFTEYGNFDEERNSELSKIIEERNKIISDINSMVSNSENYIKDESKEDISNNYEGFPANIEEEIEKTIEPIPEIKSEDQKTLDQINYEQPIVDNNSEVVNEIKEEMNTVSFPPDHTFEHKPAVEDNFDPIVISDEVDKPFTKDEDLSGNDIFTAEDTEKIREQAITGQHVINEPKSFEDVFETKNEVTSEINPPETEQNAILPPIKSPGKEETYRDRMQKRREMYEKKEGSTSKKALWIILGVVGVVILLVLLYNYFMTPPPPVDSNNNTTQNQGQQPGDNVKNTPPPVENKDEGKKTEENIETNETQTPQTSNPSSGEEIIPDNNLSIVYVRTSEGFYIQTGSYKDKSIADSKAKLIKANGKNVAVKEADLGDKGTYYRVRIGVFKTQEEAKEFAAGL
jgi:nucleoid DNA-binding protein/cell division septation protein DedD